MAIHHQSIINSHDTIPPMPSPSLKWSIILSSEKCSSSWVTALPLTDHGFSPHKGTYCDPLCLQYNTTVVPVVLEAKKLY